MTRQALLPRNSTAFEVMVSETLDRTDVLSGGIETLRWQVLSQLADALPILIAERGLSELTLYLSSSLNILAKGLAWQRVRGTPEAVRLGLIWVGYIAALIESPIYLRKWHATQLYFQSLPQDDRSLASISGIMELSLPARSYFRRGVYQYDIPALEANEGRWNESLYDNDSGKEFGDRPEIWSFGRGQEFVHDYTEAEGTLLGNWLPSGSGPITFDEANYPFSSALFSFDSIGDNGRAVLLSSWFDLRTCHAVLRDASNSIIGYRRCRVVRQCGVGPSSDYYANGSFYDADGLGSVYIEAMTDFGDADGVVATSIGLVFGAALTPLAQFNRVFRGKLWLGPNDLKGGKTIATKAISVALRSTVREQFKFLLRFQ